MQPYFNVFGLPFPAYGSMILVGIGIGCLIILVLGKRKRAPGFDTADIYLTGFISLAGAMVGAMVLRPIMKLPEVIIGWETYSQYPAGDLLGYIFGELVFYGGLIGGAIAGFLFCRGFKIPMIPVFDGLAVVVPVGHAFGRLGCLMGGCCYGMEVSPNHPFAIVYPPYSLAAPPGIPLLAIPIIEAVSLIIIAALVFLVYMKTRAKGFCLGVYLSLYAINRFVLEYYRGDAHRGFYGPFSTSQYISMGIFIIGVLCLIYAAFSRSHEKHAVQTVQEGTDNAVL